MNKPTDEITRTNGRRTTESVADTDTDIADFMERVFKATEGTADDLPAKVVVRLLANRYVTVSPTVAVLREQLHYPEYFFNVDDGQEIAELYSEVPMTELLASGELLFRAGLLRRALWILRAHGVEFELIDETGPLPHVDKSAITLAERIDQPLLQAAVDNPWGQIEIRKHQDRIRLCCQLCSLFSDSRIIVLLPKKRTVQEYADAIRSENSEAVAMWQYGRRRITVGVVHSMPPPSRSAILLLPFAERSTGKKGLLRIGGDRRWDYRRAYAFVCRGHDLDRRKRMVLEQHVGPVISSPGLMRKEVLLAMIPAPSDRMSKWREDLSWKRRAYWINQRRNRWIAGLGSAFVNDPSSALKRIVGDRIRPDDVFADGNCRVAILVESAAHARALAALLPGWQLVAKTRRASGRLPSRASSPLRLITTTRRALFHSIPCDVLIRATGGTDPLRLTRFPPFNTKTSSHPAVLLVDFTDRCLRRAERDAKRRRKHYEKDDYRMLHVDPIDFQDPLFEIPTEPS